MLTLWSQVILSERRGHTQPRVLYLRSRGSPAVRPFSTVETLGRPIDSVLRLRGIQEDLTASQSILLACIQQGGEM